MHLLHILEGNPTFQVVINHCNIYSVFPILLYSTGIFGKRRSFKKKYLAKIGQQGTAIRLVPINENLEILEMLVYSVLATSWRKSDQGSVSAALKIAYSGYPEKNISPFLSRAFVGN
jgi:hypothetical protein